MESLNEDTKRLLERVGAWEKWGRTGWGPNGTSWISTSDKWKIYEWYTPEKERLVESFYAVDYENPLFGFNIANLAVPLVEVPDGKFISRDDMIYRRGDWDCGPVVIEKFKLIFFTVPKVGATKWKQAFRRMEGLPDWKEIGGKSGLPQDPFTNGLKYLYEITIEQAEEMIRSDEWTKAISLEARKITSFLSITTCNDTRTKSINFVVPTNRDIHHPFDPWEDF